MVINLKSSLEVMHTLKLLMNRPELSLNVIALGQCAQRSESVFKVMLGIDQKPAVQGPRLITHAQQESRSIQRQTDSNGCVNHDNLIC